MNNSPSHDPKLLNLKRIAEAGSDEGPQYDRGVLDVIEEIVNTKGFATNGMSMFIISTAIERERDAGASVPDAVQGFLDANCWSLEQGVQYAKGVEDTERELDRYRVEISEANLNYHP